MAKPKKETSLTDLTFGIGQMADGSIDSFPLSELASRAAKRDAEEEATDYAMAQSELGFPGEEDDLSDLKDLEKVLSR
jgi:hypothetical protein